MNNAQYPQMIGHMKLPQTSKKTHEMGPLPKAIRLHPKVKHILEHYVEDNKKKEANLEFRRDMMQKEKTANIVNEANRIRSLLHNHTVRRDAPQGVLRTLNRRLITLQDLGG